MPKGSDSTFAAKLRQHHSGHPRFGQAAGAAARAAPGDDFTVQHYAGPVTYSAAKFLDKNRDTLSKGVADGGRAGNAAGVGGWVGGWVASPSDTAAAGNWLAADPAGWLRSAPLCPACPFRLRACLPALPACRPCGAAAGQPPAAGAAAGWGDVWRGAGGPTGARRPQGQPDGGGALPGPAEGPGAAPGRVSARQRIVLLPLSCCSWRCC